MAPSENWNNALVVIDKGANADSGNVTYRVTVGTLIRRTISVTMIIKLQQR